MIISLWTASNYCNKAEWRIIWEGLCRWNFQVRENIFFWLRDPVTCITKAHPPILDLGQELMLIVTVQEPSFPSPCHFITPPPVWVQCYECSSLALVVLFLKYVVLFVSGDGGVLKKVVRQGVGEQVPEAAYVLSEFQFCALRFPFFAKLSRNTMHDEL